MADKFSIADYIKNSVPDLGTTPEREQIEYIAEPKLSGDDGNFYSIEGIEELAQNIETVGLQQPLRVRPDPDDEGGYIVVSGHRRLTAIRTICKVDEPEKWATVPCIVERGDISPAMRELRLIFANSDTRRMSSADTAQQVERVRELLYQLQEEGVEFPGRMRDHVAEACKISKTKIATLDVISKGLSESSDIQTAWKKGRLSESTAYAFAKLPCELQDEIVEIYKKQQGWRSGDLYYLGARTVTEIEKELKKLEKMKCDVSKVACQDCADKKRTHVIKSILSSPYNAVPCTSTCCEDCTSLKSCKDVCPQLLATQKKMKADAAFAAKLEKTKQAEKDAPKIKAIQELWNRFGQARNAADVSVKDAFDAMDIFYTHDDEQKTIQKECLEAKFTPDSDLPYGYHVTLREVQRYINIADQLGVSIDYLLCRTDNPKMATGAAVNASESGAKPVWQTGEPSGYASFWCKFNCGGATIHQRAKWNNLMKCWEFTNGTKVDAECLGWYPLPCDEEGDANEDA